MPKICTEKFTYLGNVRGKTTNKGQVELDLHYDARDFYFYFKTEDIKPYFPNLRSYGIFRGCKTRDDAIGLIKVMFAENLTEERFLQIEVRIPERLYDGKVEKGGISSDMIGRFYSGSHGFGLDFKRVVKVSTDGFSAYVHASSNWKYSTKEYATTSMSNLFPWTLEAEQFLIATQGQLDVMCEKILAFFNEADAEVLNRKMAETTFVSLSE
jgi:hypothetical protein